MTKQDYEMLASVIHVEYKKCRNDEQRLTIIRLEETMATALSAQNPRFDRKKFMLACSGI